MNAPAKKAASQPLKQRAEVRTNTTKDSVCKVDAQPVTFASLWDNYVTGSPYKENGDVPKGFENQCAIRMSATLHKVGIEMKSFVSANVPVKSGAKLGRILLDGKSTAVRADQLGAWLDKQPFCGLGKTENITGADWEAKVKGRTGIIMFDGYWTRAGESASTASGGHIDLWNGSRLTVSSPEALISTIGRRIGISSMHFPGTDYGYSDLRNSKTILFWEVK
ncbi:type VI secretion system amidase effector protein Tae4 [Ralstonia mannitolilytica]|uniref:type VI secretion system amidase effector protein Tae4 n=1 Tax=Ralstonia mannitolilytica TaxID=105219 RepID=UPI0028F527DD|nr:type VI secretion system amidase effector protein Tae4 [Ralstonia mannitolilytica]CAJ0734786.1 hypothetical protein R76696_00833 [Ralstonia mannitolilytica]